VLTASLVVKKMSSRLREAVLLLLERNERIEEPTSLSF